MLDHLYHFFKYIISSPNHPVSWQVIVWLHQWQFCIEHSDPSAHGDCAPLPQAPPHTHREEESVPGPGREVHVAQGQDGFRHQVTLILFF